MSDTIVLAYSGGLDTSVALRWLSQEYGAEVVAVLVDVGQGIDVETVTRRAAQAGAADVLVVDARDEFAREFVLPVLQAGALYEGRYPLVSALSRPLISRHLVAVARERGAGAVAHGCTGKGNDQVRFETAVAALAPDLAVLAPVRDWGMTREQEISYAHEHGIEVPVKSGAAYSIDHNLWGRSIEAGPLEDPWFEPPAEAFALTMAPERALSAPQEVVVAFERGVPVAIDGEPLDLVKLIGRAGALAGAHGVGRVDMIENRLVGIKSREVYEVPAAVLLMTAYAGVAELTVECNLAHTRAELAGRYAGLVYNGLWFSPLRSALEAFMAETAAPVTGEARVKLYRGACGVVGRRAPASLYDHGLATYEQGDSYQHGAAAGFIHVWALPTKTWAAASGVSGEAPVEV
ncbi:MAG TPA: argininosuccinate synthase [Gaiellales bacterium]|nr:argininosuccinate synthase [Gaiellales bacterium]